MATVSTLTPWQSQLLLNFPVWLSSDCKAGELGCTYSHAENDQEGENNMNEYEEELLEQRAQEWDDAVDDAQDRKSTRLNSSHVKISYDVLCTLQPQHVSTIFPYTTLFRSVAKSIASELSRMAFI